MLSEMLDFKSFMSFLYCMVVVSLSSVFVIGVLQLKWTCFSTLFIHSCIFYTRHHFVLHSHCYCIESNIFMHQNYMNIMFPVIAICRYLTVNEPYL